MVQISQSANRNSYSVRKLNNNFQYITALLYRDWLNFLRHGLNCLVLLLQLQLQHGQTEEMKVKHRECREAETQLRMIEERLGMTPTQYNMPPSPATMLLTELSTPPARTATSRRAGARAAAAASASPNLSAPVVNGTNNTSGTTSTPRTRRGPPVAAEDVRSSKRTRR